MQHRGRRDDFQALHSKRKLDITAAPQGTTKKPKLPELEDYRMRIEQMEHNKKDLRELISAWRDVTAKFFDHPAIRQFQSYRWVRRRRQALRKVDRCILNRCKGNEDEFYARTDWINTVYRCSTCEEGTCRPENEAQEGIGNNKRPATICSEGVGLRATASNSIAASVPKDNDNDSTFEMNGFIDSTFEMNGFII